MGCAGSSEVDSNAPDGSASDGGDIKMFSPESHALANTKIKGRGHYGQDMVNDKSSSDASIAKGFATDNAPGQQMSIRWWKTNTFPEGISKGDLKATLSGDIDLTDAESFSVILGSYLPIQAPIAKITLPKELGFSALIFPKVRAVDIYVTVDGQAKTDGHICCGDTSLDRAGAIDHAFKKCDADKQMLTDGPASGAKPWATIVSLEFKDISFIHLPLVFSGNVDDCALPESESYAGPLLKQFGALLKEVGVGKHEWQIRLAPRGVINGPEEMATAGGFKGGGNDGIGVGAGDMYNGNEDFKRVVDNQLGGQHEAADVPGLRASFTLNCGENMCKGGGGDRQAKAYAGTFTDTLREHCKIAFRLCDKGPCSTAVRAITSGKPAHIIPSEGLNQMNSQNGREEGKRFTANAFFYASDASDPEAVGAMCNFVSAYYERKGGIDVASPKWVSEGVAGNSRDLCYAFPIKNAKIDEAIARDAGNWTANSAGAAGEDDNNNNNNNDDNDDNDNNGDNDDEDNDEDNDA